MSSATNLESWTYRDAPDYGSDELDLHAEDFTVLSVSPDRQALSVRLASTEQKQVHPQQTARVYHAVLTAGPLFAGTAPERMEAYYTLHRFPKR